MMTEPWEKTVMNDEQLDKVEQDYINEDFSVNYIRLNRGHTEDLRNRIASAQVKLTWDAAYKQAKKEDLITTNDLVADSEKCGMRKVVEWIENNSDSVYIYEEEITAHDTHYDNTLKLDLGDWQSQLRLWFKDEPELLKSWGIEEKHANKD